MHLLLEALQQQPLLLALLLERVYDVAQQSTLPGLALSQRTMQSKSSPVAASLHHCSVIGGDIGATLALLWDCCEPQA